MPGTVDPGRKAWIAQLEGFDRRITALENQLRLDESQNQLDFARLGLLGRWNGVNTTLPSGVTTTVVTGILSLDQDTRVAIHADVSDLATGAATSIAFTVNDGVTVIGGNILVVAYRGHWTVDVPPLVLTAGSHTLTFKATATGGAAVANAFNGAIFMSATGLGA